MLVFLLEANPCSIPGIISFPNDHWVHPTDGGGIKDPSICSITLT